MVECLTQDQGAAGLKTRWHLPLMVHMNSAHNIMMPMTDEAVIMMMMKKRKQNHLSIRSHTQKHSLIIQFTIIQDTLILA